VVMTDLAVALLCVATTLAAGRFLEGGEMKWAIRTGVAASCAMMIKYSAAFALLAPALLVLIDRRGDLLGKKRTWVMPAMVASVCGPWLYWSRRFAAVGVEGYQREPSLQRLRLLWQAFGSDWGPVLGSAAVLATLWAAYRWGTLSATQRLFALQLPCAAGLLFMGPTGIEARYLLPAYPGLLATMVLAFRRVAPDRASLPRWLPVAVLFAGPLLAALQPNRYGPLPSALPREVAQDLVKDAAGTPAILVPTSMEGPIVAEIASAEASRPGLILVRPSKLWIQTNWMATEYRLLTPDVQGVAALLESQPVDIILLASRPGTPDLPHDKLVRQVLEDKGAGWLLARTYADPSGLTLEVYRRPTRTERSTASLLELLHERMPQTR